MMNGWIKYYAEGSHYIGEDQLVSQGKASWRNSSLQNIVRVSMAHDGFLLQIVGPGEYWQSDSYESMFPGGSKLITRRIQKLIEPTEAFYQVKETYGKLEVAFRSKMLTGKLIPVEQSQVGQWMTLEYDIETRAAKYFISKGKH